MSTSPRDLLDAVNDAITAVLTGNQTYRLGDRSVSRANLTELYNLRRHLQREVARLDGRVPTVASADLGADAYS